MQPRIKNYRQHIIFKNITTVFVLCVFLLSITPKQTLHWLAANHKDQTAKKLVDNDQTQFNAFGFNCDCNSIVATSAFIGETFKLEISRLLHVPFYQETVVQAVSTNPHFFLKLRGPPVIA